MNSRMWLLLILCTTTAAFGQAATQPAPATMAAMQVRATQAFNRGEYSLALPMLRKLATAYKDEPDKLGPIAEEIRVCEKNLANPPPDPNAAVTNAVPSNDPPMLAEKRVPHPAPKPGQVQEMSIKELGNFEYDAEHGGNIPKDVKGMSGSVVKLRGYMIPMDQAERISTFALVPSLFACCFGQPPQIQHTIVVKCAEGKAVSYFPDEISVEGKLKVEEQKDDGYIVSVFQMDANSVKPAPK